MWEFWIILTKNPLYEKIETVKHVYIEERPTSKINIVDQKKIGPQILVMLLIFVSTLVKGFPGGTSGKESVCQCRRLKRHGFIPSIGKIFWRRAWQPTLLFFPGESHGQGAWQATVHSVAKSWTQLERFSTQAPLSNPKFGKIFLAFESRVCLRV